jgi:hypothetical protein
MELGSTDILRLLTALEKMATALESMAITEQAAHDNPEALKLAQRHADIAERRLDFDISEAERHHGPITSDPGQAN